MLAHSQNLRKTPQMLKANLSFIKVKTPSLGFEIMINNLLLRPLGRQVL